MAVTSFGGASALAESATQYPEDSEFIKSLTFESLSDYAVDGDKYAFAENKTVTLYDGYNIERITFEDEEDKDKQITALDCADGVFYCAYGESVYSLPDLKAAEFTMSEAQMSIDNGDFNYRLTGTTLKIADFSEEGGTVYTPEGAFVNLKKYGTKVYAMKDGEVCAFNGGTYEIISLEYYDKDITKESISVGNSASALKNYKSLRFVTVREGAHMTVTDLTDIDRDYFKTEETREAGKDEIALLLCYTGNAAIVSIGDTSYLVHEDNVTECKVECAYQPEFANATITGNNIYSSPYVFVDYPALSNATGTIVKVISRLECEGILGSVFYEVQYGEDEKIGYVADGLLTAYIIEDNKEPATIPDPAHNESNNTKTILLVLAVVVLVLAAVAYLAHVGTKDKKSKKKKDKSED